ncbi:MAG: cyclophilin-like fold protein [Candidatus Omnitrophota bacterium]
MRVVFETKSCTFDAQLNDTLTAKELAQRLPITGVVSRWGDEIYFEIGFKASAAGATMEVEVGDIAYWSQGKCLCVFFGATPASITEKPLPASPVVIIGRTNISPVELKKIQLGEQIEVRLTKI